MIVQIVMNFVRDVIVNWIYGWPSLPPEIAGFVDEFQDGVAMMNEYVSSMGVVMPWNTVNDIVSIWLVIFGFWLVLLVVRFAAWAFDR